MDPVELSERVARLEERMNTMQAEYRTDIARLAEDNARRDKDNAYRTIGLFIAAIVIIPILSNSAAIANLVNLFGS